MSSNTSVNEDVEKVVKDIISKNDWNPVTDIKYQEGSAGIDGYFSKTVVVDITSSKGIFHLFLKCIINVTSTSLVPVEEMYGNEIYFYDVISPTYRNFLKKRGVDDGFRNIPTCYGTLDKRIVALENLRAKGFTLFNKAEIMNESHITMVLKSLAKVHAVSFALKDQDKATYDTFSTNIHNTYGDMLEDSPIRKIFKTVMDDFFGKLNPAEDKDILDKCNSNDLIHYFANAVHLSDEYSVLTQGDCWCNNIMFLYEKNNKENPIDIMLIDWQTIRYASAMTDVSFFLYTSASEESLSKLQHYLKLYHEELSKQIKQLGSDPNKLYPFDVLLREWKEHSRYGFVFALNHVRVMLFSEGEGLNFETMDSENMGSQYVKFKKEDEYIKRMKYLTRFMIKNNYV